MREIGWTLLIVGCGLVAWGWLSPTSVHTGINYIPGVGVQEAPNVVNLGLLQTQMMLLQCGLAAIICGTVASCVGQLIDVMMRAGTAKSAPPIEFDAGNQLSQ